MRSALRESSLTYLPFIALALARVLPQFPQCNARYDAEREVLLRHRTLHLGIATQTASGLKVPVVRDVAGRSLDELAQRDPTRQRGRAQTTSRNARS